MKWPNHGAELPALDYQPPGLEVREMNFVEWLLAIGEEQDEYLLFAWQDTTPHTV